jgi:GDPmannose 4,6-dehydratase
MMQEETMEDYVVATGKTHSVREFLQLALRFADLDGPLEKYVEIEDSLFRPSEVDLLVGDARKAKEKLGWEPRTDFATLVELMVENDLRLEYAKAT